MKKLLICVLLFLSIFGLSAQSDLNASDIFSQNNDAVVYITQALYFDGKYIREPELFKLFEDSIEASFRDIYFPLSSGTGFFISNDGYIVTNHHVIAKENVAKIKRAASRGVSEDLKAILPDMGFDRQEINEIIEDFKQMISAADFMYRVKTSDDSEFTARVISSDDDVDLALLQIESATYNNYIVFDDSDSTSVGDNVVAIGYPLQSSIAAFLKDFQPTLSTGIVSALRRDNWGVQHTASINPGNSGGPLFNSAGKLIGVNVGGMPDANDIYFSIPLKKLVRFLEDNDQNELVERNLSGVKLTSTGQVVDQGPFIVGKTFLLKGGRDIKVSIDGVERGTLPQLVDDLAEGDYEIRFESDDKFHSRTFQIDADIASIKEYKPQMQYYTGNLFIDVSNVEAEVFVNDRSYGNTPCIVSNLPVGEHEIKLVNDSFNVHNESIVVTRDKTETYTYELKPKQLLSFDTELINGTVVKVINTSGDELSYDFDEEIYLENGIFVVYLEGPAYSNAKKEIEISDAPVVIITDDFITQNLILVPDLEAESTAVFIQGDTVIEVATDNLILLEEGKWSVSFTGKYYNDQVIEFEIGSEILELDVAAAHTGYPVLLANLRDDSTVILNGEDITALVEDSIVYIKPGKNSLKVKTPTFINWETEIDVASADVADIIVPYILTGQAQKDNNVMISAGTTIAGTALLGFGLYRMDDLQAFNGSVDYDSYTTHKIQSYIIAGSGLTIAILGAWWWIHNTSGPDISDNNLDKESEDDMVKMSFHNGIFLDISF